MKRDIQLISDDILEMIAVIETIVANKTRADLAKDRWRNLQSSGLSKSSRRPASIFQSVRSTGNILRHEYHLIADEVIWDVIIADLPALKQAMQTIRAMAPGA